MRYSAAIFAIATMVAAPAFGGGFSVSEQSGKATGQGGAVTASVSDSAAMYYNIAGLSKVTDLHLTIGTNAILTRASFQQEVSGDLISGESNNPVGIVPSLYAAYKVSDQFALGFAFFNTWGSTVYMPKSVTNSAGESVPNPQADVARKTALKTPTVSLGVSWSDDEFIEGLALGASVDAMMGTLYSYRNLYFGEDLAKVEINASALAVGARFGFQYDSPDSEGLSAGMSVKLPMTLNFTGDADFDMMGTSPSAADYRAALPPDGEASGSLTLPFVLNVAISDVLMDGDLRISAEVALTHWESYEELRFTLPDGTDAATAKNWNNTATYRFGAEYKAAENIMVRAGYVFDMTPVPSATLDTSLVDMDRHFVTAGLGATFGDVTIDFAGMYKVPTGKRWSRTQLGVYLAEYDLEALVVALHFGYQFNFADGGSGDGEAAAEAE